VAVSVSADTPAEWQALGNVPLLALLPDERLRALWASSVARHHPAGDVMRIAGTPARHLLILLPGRVSATATTRAGRVIRFGEWAAPCALDEVAVIDGGGHTATLTALTPCELRSLPREHFLSLVDDVPRVRGHVLRVLAEHARHHQERFTAAATVPAEARLAAWLLKQAATNADRRVALPDGQQALADLLGVTRVTVNRALARLRRDGLIEITRRAVDIRKPELLGLRACDGDGAT
jgi:CRP/FNR family cyclic AMP-dependent transcriptional regulator